MQVKIFKDLFQNGILCPYVTLILAQEKQLLDSKLTKHTIPVILHIVDRLAAVIP